MSHAHATVIFIRAAVQPENIKNLKIALARTLPGVLNTPVAGGAPLPPSEQLNHRNVFVEHREVQNSDLNPSAIRIVIMLGKRLNRDPDMVRDMLALELKRYGWVPDDLADTTHIHVIFNEHSSFGPARPPSISP